MDKSIIQKTSMENTLKLYYCAILFFASSVLAFSEGAVIKGRVTDGSTNEPLVGATIEINEKMMATTSITGFFKIDNVKHGKHILKARYVGYYTAEETLEVAEDTTHVMMKLENKPILNTEEPRITLKENGVKYSINAYLPANVSDTLALSNKLPFILKTFKNFTKIRLTDSRKDYFNIDIIFNSIDEFYKWKEKKEVKKFTNHFRDLPNAFLTTNLEILKTNILPNVKINSKAGIKFTVRYRKRIGTKSSNMLFAGFIKRFNKEANIHSIKINQVPRNIECYAKFIFPSIQDFLDWHQNKVTLDNFNWMEKDISEDDRIEYKFDVDFIQN